MHRFTGGITRGSAGTLIHLIQAFRVVGKFRTLDLE